MCTYAGLDFSSLTSRRFLGFPISGLEDLQSLVRYDKGKPDGLPPSKSGVFRRPGYRESGWDRLEFQVPSWSRPLPCG